MKRNICFMILLWICFSNLAISQETISIFQVIANPSKFNGKLITVSGVFRTDLSTGQLYATADHFKFDIVDSSIWLEYRPTITYEQAELLSKLDGQFVLITGVFNESMKRFAQGTLRDVSSIIPVSMGSREKLSVRLPAKE